MPEASNTFTVHCDICGDQMQKQADVYACYPCKHMLWESELHQYEGVIKHEAQVDVSQSA
jgi:hypothetical protein